MRAGKASLKGSIGVSFAVALALISASCSSANKKQEQDAGKGSPGGAGGSVQSTNAVNEAGGSTAMAKGGAETRSTGGADSNRSSGGSSGSAGNGPVGGSGGEGTAAGNAGAAESGQSGGAYGSAGTGQGGASAGSGGDEGPAVCGTKTCAAGEFCCNESCGICATIEGFCTQQVCARSTELCDYSDIEDYCIGDPYMIKKKFCLDGSIAVPICKRDGNGQCDWDNVECAAPDTRQACGKCAGDEYCEVANCGRNGEKGVCSRGSVGACGQASTEPVCGCDGNTYANRCRANAAGVSVDHKSACESPPCAEGFADCNGDLKDGCETSLMISPENCGRCGNSCGNGLLCVAGECENACPDLAGDCDGNTQNGCETALITARNCGACGRACPGTACVIYTTAGGGYGTVCSFQRLNCGGVAGLACPSDQWCNYGDGCDAVDGMGLCTDTPTAIEDILSLRCGCDNWTYGNEQEAAASGVSIRYPGPCKIGVCTYGMDQTCNDDPTRSSIDGHCNQNGTCICNRGYNAWTGRCL